MKKYITTDGKTCREVNPHEKPQFTGGAYDFDTKWKDFESTVQHYPIHSPNPIRGEFWGEVVEQLFSPTVGWVNESEVKDLTKYTREKRTAVIPSVPVKGEEKEDWKYLMLQAGISDLTAHTLGFLFDRVHNSTIDACIEAANSLPYKPFLLIDKLNSLRK